MEQSQAAYLLGESNLFVEWPAFPGIYSSPVIACKHALGSPFPMHSFPATFRCNIKVHSSLPAPVFGITHSFSDPRRERKPGLFFHLFFFFHLLLLILFSFSLQSQGRGIGDWVEVSLTHQCCYNFTSLPLEFFRVLDTD